ncbi:MAG: PAS domain S-box protein [Promethearchaeota archaeon]
MCPSFLRLVTTVEEMKKWSLKDVIKAIHPDDLEFAMKQLSKKQKGAQDVKVHYQYRGIKKNGEIIWVDNYSKPINYLGRSADLVTIIDITERKEAEQKIKVSEKKYRDLANLLPQVICETDKRGNLIFINQNAFRVFGYTQDDFNKGLNALQMLIPEDRKRAMKNIARISRGENVCAIEYTALRKDGSVFPVIIYASPIIRKNQSLGMRSIIIDITKRKEAEQKLKESEKNYREAYDRANFYKDLFTHDINNILNNIQSSMELSNLYLTDPKKLNKLKGFNKIIRGQVDRGIKLVSVVRNLFDLEETELLTKSMDLYKLIKDTKEFVIKSFPEKKVNIKIDALSKKLLVQANELLLDVLENILINAVKYNENPDVNITIKISKKESKGKKYLKIEFMDNGIGVKDASKELIFQKGHEEHKGVKGMGLGLSLVKKIIDRYEGQIWVEDRIKGDYTRGSNFILLIPEAE